MDSSKSSEAKVEPKVEPKPEEIDLAPIFIPEVSFALKSEPFKKEEPREEDGEDPGLADCPLAHNPEAQLAALAPVVEEDDEEEEVPAPAATQRVASISVPFKREYKEPAPPGEEGEDDPFGLGPRRSRSPPATRAQLRSIAATASQKPRKKTSFYPSR